MEFPMQKFSSTLLNSLAGAALFAAASAGAQTIDTAWADWTSIDSTTAVSGQLVLPSGIVKVRFSGPTMYFAQVADGDTDYWSGAAYEVTGAPTGSDIIGFKGGTDKEVYKISFSKPVTNPVVAVMSLGRAGIPTRYVFGQVPTLLSSGVGFFGGCDTCLKVKRKTLTGTEGHGVVQFMGTYKAITWKQPDFEFWHGMTIGAPTADN
jgi:hypothetical protein